MTHGLGSRDTRTNVQNGFKERNGEPLAVPKQQWWQERLVDMLLLRGAQALSLLLWLTLWKQRRWIWS